MPDVRIIGRESSHFTRVARIFALELDVPFTLTHVSDLTSLDASDYAGHPALKVPALVTDGEVSFGTENICRRLAELSPRGSAGVVWPELVTSTTGRNAHELVLHAMAAEVTLVLAPGLGKVPPDNPFVHKVVLGLTGALTWLDGNLDAVLDSLPAPRALSWFEVALFCLVEHIGFRASIPMAEYPRLLAFAQAWGERASSRVTAYRYVESRRKPPAASLMRPALDPREVQPRTSSAYPAVFHARVLPREKRALGDALGLTRFGANLTTLHPGKQSSLRHHHSREEELVYVLEGELVLRTDEGEQTLGPGMCVGFPAGTNNGHQLENRSTRPARYLEVGTREPDDTVGYPDDDLVAHKDEQGRWQFSHRDGTPY
jgi:uncharacterized cupin superfamily protein/glutathione S-transferase